jgi:hypothetical protein
MPRSILILAAIAALIYVALCLALFLAQRSFIYFPQPQSTSDNGTTLSLTLDGERILVATSTAPALAGHQTIAVPNVNSSDLTRT